MKYYLVKLTGTNTQVTLRFDTYTHLRTHLREMLNDANESIVAIYIGL